MQEKVEADPDIKYVRSVIVEDNGEARTYYTPRHVVRSNENFEMPIYSPTKKDYVTALLIPDIWEILMFVAAFYLNYIFIKPLVNEPVFSTGMIVFWGIFSLIMTTGRHAYWGPGHFAARQALITKNHLQGKFEPDFKLIGMIVSLYMIFFSDQVSAFFNFLLYPF